MKRAANYHSHVSPRMCRPLYLLRPEVTHGERVVRASVDELAGVQRKNVSSSSFWQDGLEDIPPVNVPPDAVSAWSHVTTPSASALLRVHLLT